jgi:hypothetical protein
MNVFQTLALDLNQEIFRGENYPRGRLAYRNEPTCERRLYRPFFRGGK